MAETQKVIEAKRAVVEALVVLVQEKSFSEVTVADICEASGLSRSAFYRLFSGIKAILPWYAIYCGEQGHHRIGRDFTCEEGQRHSMRLFALAKPAVIESFKWFDNDMALPSINNQVHAMEETLRSLGRIVDKKTQVELAGIAWSCFHVIGKWYSLGCPFPEEELVKIIVSFYPDHLRELFDHAARH